MLVGGSAAPRSMIAGFKQRHGLNVVPRLGDDGDVAGRIDGAAASATLARRGRGDAVRLHRDAGRAAAARRAAPPRRRRRTILPWDGESMGELEIRGPWVAAGYYDTPEQADRWTDDGWFKTGDVVSLHPTRLHPDQGPLEGRDQVGRRVDLVGRARERADGAPGGRRGGGDRRARRRSGTSGRSRPSCCARARPRPPTSCARSSRRLREVVAARPLRVRRRRSRRRASASSRRRSSARCSRRVPA